MSISFRAAVVVSLSIHLAAAAAFYGLPAKNATVDEPAIELFYFFTEENVMPSLPEIYDLEKKETVTPRIPGSVNAPADDGAEEDLERDERGDISQKKNYIEYYSLIREKIKKELSKYASPNLKGSLDLEFTIDKFGALYDVNAIDDMSPFKNIALKALKRASPFPAFPAALKEEHVRLGVTIYFERSRE